MARILYGVMGDARGHVNRARTIAQGLPQHEFLFVGAGRVHDLQADGYSVEFAPMAATLYRNNRVDIPGTLANAFRVFGRKNGVVRRIARLIDDYDPHLILSDYEFFTPRAAISRGRPCVSLDHQHILTHCRYQPPAGQRLSRAMTCFAVRNLYSRASVFLIVSFFPLPVKDPETSVLLPPLIRGAVLQYSAKDGEHALVYQTSPTFSRLFPVLEQMKTQFIVYGFGQRSSRKNITFKGASDYGFLEDLASARYVVTNGGHNVISEALYLGKTVFAFPIANAYEQFVNSYFLAQCGYGAYSCSSEPSPQILTSFESKLESYKTAIQSQNLFGNQHVLDLVDRLTSSPDLSTIT
jgi:uncharacterized protein (TIGR00661 family)